MPLRNFPEGVKEFALQAYSKPKNKTQLRETHVAFTGTPQMHYHDPDKVILVTDPFSSNTFYYEFLAKDISFVEEVGTTVNMEGEALPMMRLWVKKRSIGIRSTPFVVEDTFIR
ncbi:MAG: inorganic pyrophosphatase Ppa [Proteobacteria bacterium]|nr:inorganic pyrophosphatase Ppa [Pseudomonadota bacterium]MBU1641154.1 inorganic pyrophosphatase Ppa [Pseudomonadota bacterium]